MHSDYRPGIEPNPLSYATSLSSELGCEEWEDNDLKEILKCLQALPYRELYIITVALTQSYLFTNKVGYLISKYVTKNVLNDFRKIDRERAHVGNFYVALQTMETNRRWKVFTKTR